MGDSERRQVEAGQRWAKKMGITQRVIVDRGLSAFSGEHLVKGQIAAFLRDVDAGAYGKGTTLIVESLDRLSRAVVMEAVHMITGLIIKGLRVVELRDGKEKVYEDPNSFGDLIELASTAHRANNESATKQTRVREAWDIIRRGAYSGRPVTATLPYAYKLSGRERDPMGRIKEAGKIVAEEHLSKVVIVIFELTSLGWSANAIARLLNGGKHRAAQERRTTRTKPLPVPDLPFDLPVPPPTKGRKPKQGAGPRAWSQPTVRYVLNNRSYLGEYQPCTGSVKRKTRKPLGEVVSDYYPRIVSDDLWASAHRAMEFAGTGKKTHRMGSTNLFTGINRCGCCGTAGSISIKQSDKKSVKKVVCRRGKDGSGVCPYREFPAATMEEAVLGALREHIDPARIVADVENSSHGRDLTRSRDELRGSIERSKQEVDATTSWAVSNRVTGALLDNAMAKVEVLREEAEVNSRRLAEIERELACLTDVISGLTEVVAELDELIPFVVGHPFPVVVNGWHGHGGEKVEKAFRERQVRETNAEGQRDVVRARLKLLIARLVREVVIDPTTGRWSLALLDGKIVEGVAKEKDAVERSLDQWQRVVDRAPKRTTSKILTPRKNTR